MGFKMYSSSDVCHHTKFERIWFMSVSRQTNIEVLLAIAVVAVVNKITPVKLSLLNIDWTDKMSRKLTKPEPIPCNLTANFVR